ncbi:MAG: hypothetical protein HYW63_01370 [Candidatus Levybacteria bacterium]|nr:hypothetical protein [Candidatus Levybacteria bacterium]
MFINRKKEAGQSLVELLIAIGLATLLLPALITGLVAARGGRAQQEQRLEATAYLRQSQEAVRSIAQRSFSNIATNGTYYTEISNGRFELVAGTQSINDYTLSVVISDVYRNSNGDIVSSGGSLDPSTKKIVSTVSWNSPIVSSVSNISYFTRHKNEVYIETTVDDFTPGTANPATTGISITDSDGGEITLSAGSGGGDWCSPELILATFDLPKNGVANAISAIEGKISAGTGENASGVSFASVDVTTDYPPALTLEATFVGYKTNDVFGETDYAYLATDNNSKEIVIIDLNNIVNGKYQEVGYFDAPGNGDGDAVSTSGNYGYMTSGNKFYIFDLSSKSGSRAKVNTSDITLSGTGIRIQIIGGFAYVATSASANQLQIIDISNSQAPSIVGQISVNGLGGKDVVVNTTGTRAYLVTGASSTQGEFFIIDTQNKNSPTLVGGGVYDTNGMDPKGVTVVTGNKAIVVGTGGTNQYQVVNINNESAPVNCGNLVVASGINGVSSVLQSNGYAYSYIITADSTSELKIILGGAGSGSSYSSSGVFESQTFDAGGNVTWNRISATSSIPQNTTLQFRVALKDSISNSCSSVVFDDSDFVGETGDPSSFFPLTGGVLTFNDDGQGYENPSQCMRYRAYLSTSDSTQTPVVYDVSINYSP